MTISPRPIYLILAAACVCGAVAVSPFAHSQAVPASARQEQNVQPDGSEIFSLYAFIQNVGKEDDHIQKEAKEGRGQTTERTDYAAAIGISGDAEQTEPVAQIRTGV